jgi:hypothetical protein
MLTIKSNELDSVCGGRSQQQRIRDAGNEALFCAGLDRRAERAPSPGPSWYAARKDLASTCWENFREVLTPPRETRG